MRTNCNELATILEEVELKTMNVPHWSSVIYPLTQERRLSMDTGIAFLHDIDVALSTYFREGDFTHLQFGKGSGQDMLSCLLAVIKGNSRTDLLVTILNSDVDEKNPKYSRFDIPDLTVLSKLRSYLRRNGQLIFDLVTSDPDGAPIPSTVNDLTVRDLARYLSFQRWKDMTAEERREAMQPALNALSNKREGMTAEERREAMQPALNAPRPKNDAKWTANFNKLEAFKTVNGNLNIPANHELYDWTKNQRSARSNPKSKYKLTEERIALLDGLGFNWR